MPFTPLHMGPGLLIKALLQGSFSLLIFGWTQILMDIQPLLAMLNGADRLHGFTHSYLGATLIALGAALTGKYAAEFALRRIARPRDLPLGWPAVFGSAFIGAYSHVLLDSVMHSDLQPFAPFAAHNPMLNLVSIEWLHLFCLYSGLLGTALYFAIAHWLNKRRQA